jgi:predicted murein hydrolase (TIGR00659 family)
MKELIVSDPMLWITLSIIIYVICSIIYRKTKLTILNPLLLTILMICGILSLFHIKFNDYNSGGQFITLMLSPATVVLAVPVYDQLHLIKKNAAVILVSIFVGSLTSMLSVFVLCRAFGLDKALTMSLIPKSVTTAIAIGVSANMGGIKAVTVMAVLLSGILGAVIGPSLCRLLHIKNRVAVGLALGTSAHAVGTSKAIELGEDEGAMGGLAVGVAGLITVIVAPLLITILMRIWA